MTPHEWKSLPKSERETLWAMLTPAEKEAIKWAEHDAVKDTPPNQRPLNTSARSGVGHWMSVFTAVALAVFVGGICVYWFIGWDRSQDTKAREWEHRVAACLDRLENLNLYDNEHLKTDVFIAKSDIALLQGSLKFKPARAVKPWRDIDAIVKEAERLVGIGEAKLAERNSD